MTTKTTTCYFVTEKAKKFNVYFGELDFFGTVIKRSDEPLSTHISYAQAKAAIERYKSADKSCNHTWGGTAVDGSPICIKCGAPLS